MRLFLGIDGGGTGCRGALAGQDGVILAQAEGGAANIASDPKAALANILALANDVLAQCDGSAADAAKMPDLHVAMGLAGANIPACVIQLRAGLPFTKLRVETDALTALKGALRDADGIVAAIGTGSVFARQSRGGVRRIGGRGLALGDEGSGAWLGRALLAASLRAVDGFADVTPLMQSILKELGGEDGVMAFGSTARPGDYARFARQIIGSDDPAACAVMAAAEADIAAAITLLQPETAVPVVFLGGLGAHFAKRFHCRWEIRPALGTGLDGALWLARQDGAFV